MFILLCLDINLDILNVKHFNLIVIETSCSIWSSNDLSLFLILLFSSILFVLLDDQVSSNNNNKNDDDDNDDDDYREALVFNVKHDVVSFEGLVTIGALQAECFIHEELTVFVHGFCLLGVLFQVKAVVFEKTTWLQQIASCDRAVV